MKKTKSGFTIVELLIVIVVIAILAAIAIVAYSGIQTRARNTERSSDLSNLGKQLELFRAENGTTPTSDSDFKKVLQSAGYWDITRSSNSNVKRFVLCASSGGSMGIIWMSAYGQSVNWNIGAERPYWSTSKGISIAVASSTSSNLTDVCADIGIDTTSSYRNWAHNLT